MFGVDLEVEVRLEKTFPSSRLIDSWVAYVPLLRLDTSSPYDGWNATLIREGDGMGLERGKEGRRDSLFAREASERSKGALSPV